MRRYLNLHPRTQCERRDFERERLVREADKSRAKAVDVRALDLRLSGVESGDTHRGDAQHYNIRAMSNMNQSPAPLAVEEENIDSTNTRGRTTVACYCSSAESIFRFGGLNFSQQLHTRVFFKDANLLNGDVSAGFLRASRCADP